MNKKIKKMINNPKLFFKDMWRKRILKIQATAPKKYNCRQSYNIVIVGNESTVNINECLNSIKAQRINLDININLIVLNLGLAESQLSITQTHDVNVIDAQLSSPTELAGVLTGKYTIFVWADDFLEINFILRIDQFINTNKTKNFGIIYSRPLKGEFYSKIGKEYHPLRGLYKSITPVGCSPEQLVAETLYGTVIPTSAFLTIIQSKDTYNCLDFNGLEVILSATNNLKANQIIGFSKLSSYISYENTIAKPFKGSDWLNHELFGSRFSDIVDLAETIIIKNKKWNSFTRKTLLFFIIKYINKGLINQSLLDNCNNNQQQNFINEIKKAINVIGLSTIDSFNFSNSPIVKYGCANWLNETLPNKNIDIIQYDNDKDVGLLRYYTSNPKNERFNINGDNILPFVDKTILHKLFNHPFSYERRIWLPLQTDNPTSKLMCFIDHQEVNVRGLDKKLYRSIQTANIKKNYCQSLPQFKLDPVYENVWIFMDRDNQADDNAEHLYRYVMNNRPDIDAYFVLNRNSHDWDRLSNEGFKMLAFGSPEHESALESCSRVISSHAAQFATDYFKDKRMLSKKFIFLQHGVIHNDQSSLFKPDWKRFDIFLTSAYGEYESIGGELSTYKFTSKEVKLTGLPRHDALIKSTIKPEKMLLIMPTWRPSLLGRVTSGTERELLPDFINSQYAQAWMNIINNPKLREYAKLAGYKIVFFPHANIQPYLDQFNVPDDVEILNHAAGSIQELFLKASMMITDYSSVAFEMAYLYKPVCYYQFDEEDFFTKGHYNKGYFDYREHGFGPVYNDENNVIEYAIKNIQNDCTAGPEYISKVDNFFPYRDGLCCERVLKEIESLDFPTESSYKDGLITSANKAFQLGLWQLASSKYEVLFNTEQTIEISEYDFEQALVNYIDCLQQQGEIDKAEILLTQYSHLESDAFKKVNIKVRLCSDILHNQFTTISKTGLSSFSKIDYTLFLTMFGSIYKNVISKDSANVAIDNKTVALFFRLCSETPIEALALFRENKYNSSFEFEFFHADLIELILLDASELYDDLIILYNQLSNSAKDSILNKLLYLRALRECKKWKRVQEIIGTDPILQGRTGIVEFASNYFFVANYDKKKIKDIEEFDYIKQFASSVSPLLIQHIIKYHLIIGKDIERASLLIDLFIDNIDPRLVSVYIKSLVYSNKPEKAYSILQTYETDALATPMQFLYGHLALTYGDYDIAEKCFQHVVLAKLPAIDKESSSYLQSARILKMGKQEYFHTTL